MLAPTSLINALETMAPINGGVSTLILAVLYWMQHGKISKQTEILEEQQKITKFEQTPYLVGPYNMKYDNDSQSLVFELSNVGDGPARGVSIRIVLFSAADERPQKKLRLTSSRTDVGFLEPNTIYPAEEEVTFAADMSDLTIEAEDSDHISEPTEIPLSDHINNTLQDDAGTLNILYEVTYSDVFGESTDPFGRDYKLISPTMGLPPQSTLEDHLETISIMQNHQLNQSQ